MIQPKSSFPVFVVRRIAAAKEFYSKVFDFQVVFENEWYLHLASPSGVQVGFMLPDQPSQPAFFRSAYAGGGVIFSLEVDAVEAAHAFAKERGLRIVADLRSEDWGQRHFVLEDPNGIHIDVVQAIPPADAYRSAYTEPPVTGAG